MIIEYPGTNLFRQLLLAKLVEREELSGQGDVLQEAAAGQLHSDDDLTIGNHHGHVPELNLEKNSCLKPNQAFYIGLREKHPQVELLGLQAK